MKQLMILVMVFAVLNGAFAWVARTAGSRGATAKQRQEITAGFVFLNCTIAIAAAFALASGWIQRVEWHKRTGGGVERPKPEKLSRRQAVQFALSLAAVVLWMVATLKLMRWLTPRIWPVQRDSLLLWVLLTFVPLLVGTLRQPDVYRVLAARIRVDWQGASWPERIGKVTIAFLATIFVVLMTTQPRLLFWGTFPPKVPIPFGMMLVMLFLTALRAGIAFSTRRR